MASGIIYVKGRQIDQRKLRKFLKELDTSNIDQFQTEDGMWESPITGELFRTKQQLWGSFGAYLRTINHKDPKEPTRAGYVRALRRGLEPTPEQKRAHAQYNKAFRKSRRERLLPSEEPESQVPVMSME